MRNNYDNIASSYDLLSRLVFFRSQVKAQIEQLKYIPEGSNVLIAGGGTGWILEEIAKIHPSGLSITYVEISAKMLEISQKRNTKANTITYIRSSIEDFKPAPNRESTFDSSASSNSNFKSGANVLGALNKESTFDSSASRNSNFKSGANVSDNPNKDAPYDIIITAFLFDNFLPEKVNSVFTQLNSYLKNGGSWLFCDFNYEENSGKKWQLYLLKTMYLFFRYIAHVEARSLTQTVQLFTNSRYTVENEAYYYKGFIKSVVYYKHEQG